MSHETPSTDPTTPDAELEAELPSEEFAQALAAYEEVAPAPSITEVSVGSKVSARVVSIGDENTLVDFGGRSEGAVETRHFRNEDGTVRVNVDDTLELYVIEAGDQIVLAPNIKTEPNAAMGQLREAHASGAPVSGRVTAVNAGGLAVDLTGVRGFCPMSQIESGFCADPSVYVGRTLEFIVTSVEEGRGSVVLSRRQILRRAEAEEGKVLLATLKVGDEREGKIRKLEAFGAFVDLGGIDGLVHISELSHSHVGHPKQVVKEGETVKVRILKIGTGKDGRPKLALSIKAAAADPWQGIETRYAVGAHVTGTVARMTEFGAFISLEPGIDGLVHVSQAALHRVTHVKEVFKTGQSVEAIVLAVEPEKKRIALSVREVLAGSLPPARSPEVGEVVEGRVGSIKPFGVFVDLPVFGPRASGLMPREESGFPRGTDLATHFTVGQVVRVEMLESKEGKLRLRLEGATPQVEDRAPRPERAAGSERGPGAGAGSGGPRTGGAPRGGSAGGPRGGAGGGMRGGSGGGGPRGGGVPSERSDRGGRGGPGGGRGGREERGPQSWSTPVSPNEPTMMALALRKAMEEAKRKAEGKA